MVTGSLFSSRTGSPVPSSSSMVTPSRGVSPSSSLSSSAVTVPEIRPNSSTKSLPVSSSPGAKDTGMMLSLSSVGN